MNLRQCPRMLPESSFRLKLNAGFTLVELMIAMVLSLFLLGGLVLTFGTGRTAALEAEQLSRAQENIRFASDYLVRDFRNAGFTDIFTITIDEREQIEQNFAEIVVVDGAPRLRVRYVGSRACGQDVGVLGPIENEYYLDGADLICRGTRAIYSASPIIGEPVVLASGLAAMEFEFLIPDADPTVTSCRFENVVNPDAAVCVGLRARLTFDMEPNRQMELTSSFRNVILNNLFSI
jgi:prepilin-type N-terminal cleavage/methylation domain-containing protein